MKKVLFCLAFMGCFFLPKISEAQACMPGYTQITNNLSCEIEISIGSCGPWSILASSQICENLSSCGSSPTITVEDPSTGVKAEWTPNGSGCISGDATMTPNLPYTQICGQSVLNGEGCLSTGISINVGD